MMRFRLFRVLICLALCLILCASASAAEQRSTLYYLYVTACESCGEASALLDALPEVVEVTRDGEVVSSQVEVVRVNLTADVQRALALFDAYHVPEDDRIAPMVLAGDGYYAGVDAIRRFLSDELPAGAALDTRVVSGEGALPALEWGSALAAGLIGGLNPCALSMLLMLLAALANLNTHAVRYVALFLGAKFITYLLIGTLLLGAFEAWNPAWLALAAKLALTLLSIVLIGLNLRDAWMAWCERYGEVKNQLPVPLRRGLQASIRSAIEKPFGPLSLVVVALGALVAAGEFLCAGQVYLATLLASIQVGRDLAALWPMLIGYCLAFLLPSAAVCFAVVRGQALFSVSEFVRRRMPLIKLITALFFAAVVCYVWIA